MPPDTRQGSQKVICNAHKAALTVIKSGALHGEFSGVRSLAARAAIKPFRVIVFYWKGNYLQLAAG